MATDTQTATALLEEAAAIVEAEWMRLERDEDLWAEVADLFAEMPAPRPRPPRAGVAPTQSRRSGQPLPDQRRRWALRGGPLLPVWATQRSPPRTGGFLVKGTVGQRRRCPSDDPKRQRLARRAQ
jgi:uncharacterized membrane protein